MTLCSKSTLLKAELVQTELSHLALCEPLTNLKQIWVSSIAGHCLWGTDRPKHSIRSRARFRSAHLRLGAVFGRA